MVDEFEMKCVSNNKCFGGYQKVFEHFSDSLKWNMVFSVFVPSGENTNEHFPALFYLPGVSTSSDYGTTMAGFQRFAAQYKIIVVVPDTGPRNCHFPNVVEKRNVGNGVSMYVNATQEPWKKHYQMYTYITEELYRLVNNNFPVTHDRISITGHSLGGHGALLCGLLNPDKYKSVSALAPVCSISNSPVLIEGLKLYVGEDENTLQNWDATFIVRNYSGPKRDILIHVGTEDKYLKEDILIDNFVIAVSERQDDKIQLKVNFEEGYDHGYYFISTFIEEHVKFHASKLLV